MACSINPLTCALPTYARCGWYESISEHTYEFQRSCCDAIALHAPVHGLRHAESKHLQAHSCEMHAIPYVGVRAVLLLIKFIPHLFDERRALLCLGFLLLVKIVKGGIGHTDHLIA
mmetsp:Transcript_16520/g.45755  ORF Transcript_16520/g.45755 Transcript_16520/m.45755 type:complete len:116 (+) Transcript_16520:232-579(+)